jgi:hypothetical protein
MLCDAPALAVGDGDLDPRLRARSKPLVVLCRPMLYLLAEASMAIGYRVRRGRLSHMAKSPIAIAIATEDHTVLEVFGTQRARQSGCYICSQILYLSQE